MDLHKWRVYQESIKLVSEVAACLEVGHRLGTLPRNRFDALWDQCDHITRMLGKLIAGG